MAGCCHGAETDAWHGIYHVSAGVKYVPVQLFEAVFLFALAAFMFYRTSKKRINGLAAYMVCYGIWRYFAEYFRADDRGSTVVSFWSPSQLVSVLLIVGGAALGVSVYLYYKKKGVSYYED
jgi:phosphatidylglycerol:prolipoprotein diacylglycerol transferase